MEAPVREREPVTPERSRLLQELRIVAQPVRWLVSGSGAVKPVLDRSSSPTRRVMTIPGFGATDRSMLPLRAYLRKLGHEVMPWGLGRNNGDVQAMLDATLERVDDLCTQADELDLVGWSLGGVVAREVARDRPDKIRSVITFGTPVTGPRHTVVGADNYGEEGMADIERQIDEREAVPITVPVTSMYSKNDGIVDWVACIDVNEANGVEHVEVAATHFGMGTDPAVWRIIADGLR